MGPREIPFLSRTAGESFLSSQPYIVLSLTDPKTEPAALRESPLCKGICRLVFHDLDQVPQELITDYALVLFTPAMADTAVAFVMAHPEARVIMVHCEAGISRSAGMAAAIAKVLNGSDAFYFKYGVPNRRVYAEMLAAFARRLATEVECKG